jgi:hypothetical protein
VGVDVGLLTAAAGGLKAGAVRRAKGVARATITANKTLRTAFLLLVLHHDRS